MAHRAGLAAVLAFWPLSAGATYSIVATDQGARQVGGAGASCVGSLSVRVIYGSVPGKGAVHAQALLGSPGLAEAVRELEQGVPPEEIIATISDPEFDPDAQERQFGVVDLQGRAAGFTGSQTLDHAEDRQGQAGSFAYSVQGNILTSPAVLDQAAGAFAGGGCDLADRLLLALEAGAQNGEGDSRCTDQGIPADSAFLEVDREGETQGAWLLLDVTSSSPDDPLVLLRAEYDAWRQDHPCPTATPDGGAPSDASGGDDAGGPSADGIGGACGCRAAGRGRRPTGLPIAALLALLGLAGRRSALGHLRHGGLPALGHLGVRDILLVRGDRPFVPERVRDLAVPISPEHVGGR